MAPVASLDLETDQLFAAQNSSTPVTVYQCCRRAARGQNVVTYDDVNQMCGLGPDFGDPSDRARISNMLGDVSEFEARNGRPLLSAVVILKGVKPMTPGPGFFDSAWLAKVGVKRGPKEDNQLFFARMLKEVFAYWNLH